MKCQKLIYKSPLHGSVYCDELILPYEHEVDFGPEGVYYLLCRSSEVEEFMQKNTEDLASCIPPELEDVVVKAVFGECVSEDTQAYLLTSIYVKEELTDLQHELIREWITGQLSDGWGESLEQRCVYQENVYYDRVVFCSDTADFDVEQERAEAFYYIHPWCADSGWNLELVGREPAELDIEEPDTQEELRKAVLKIKELVDQIVEELKNVT